MKAQPILMYHAVSNLPDPLCIQVKPERLRSQLSTLRRLGYQGVSMRELLDVNTSRSRRVGLTFDDGYTDFATTVVPMLAEYDFTATVFMVAGHIGGTTEWDLPERRSLMSRGQLREVHQAGHEVGSHGVRHLRSDRLSPAELDTELADSRKLLEDTVSAPVIGFCYPYGAVTSDAAAAVKRHYSYGCAIAATPGSSPWTLPRFFVGESDSPLRLTAKLVLRPARERLQRRAS